MLYIIVCRDKIKTTEVIDTARHQNDVETAPHPVNLSISRIIHSVKNKDVLRYLPGDMFDSGQRESEYEGVVETIIYTLLYNSNINQN